MTNKKHSPVEVQEQHNIEHRRKQKKHILDWFHRPHTLLALSICIALVVWVAFTRNEKESEEKPKNILYGLSACCGFFLVFSSLNMPDSLFTRPHVIVWRIVLGVGVLYALLIVFLLFQDLDDVRQWLTYLDSTLGIRLIMKDYASDCRLITPDHPHSYFANFKETLFEGFAAAHLLGWWVKTLIFRDVYLVFITSVLFEIWEYSLEHILPNFKECWWDHWVIDVFGCNFLGMILGVLTIKFFQMKEYNWATGNAEEKPFVIRALFQLTPKTFDHYYFNILSSGRRMFIVTILVIFFSLVELNVFFLKYLLWIPPPHPLVLSRLVLMAAIGVPCLREFYHFVITPTCYRLGPNVWIFCSICLFETLLCIKYGREEFKDVETPLSVSLGWMSASFALATFSIYRLAYHGPPEEKKKEKPHSS